jgi:hypothetical protein
MVDLHAAHNWRALITGERKAFYSYQPSTWAFREPDAVFRTAHSATTDGEWQRSQGNAGKD